MTINCSCRRENTELVKVKAADLLAGDAILMASGHAGQPIDLVKPHPTREGFVVAILLGCRERDAEVIDGTTELVVERDPKLWWISASGHRLLDALA